MATFEDLWAEMTGREQHAFHMKAWAALGGQEAGEVNMSLLMAGRLRFKVEEIVETFFDDTTGRRVPPLGMKGVLNPNSDFLMVQLAIGYADRLARITRHLAGGQEFISAVEFATRSKAVIARIADSKQTKNLLKCPYFPFTLPRMEIADHGTTLDETILPAVGRAYVEQFSNRRFENYRKGTLAGHVTVVEGSRHERFLDAVGKAPVVGVYFPCLQGFPLEGDIQQMGGLPEEFLLAGAIDTAAVQMMYPDVVAGSYNTPGLDCAALRWQSDCSLCFEASDDRLYFSRRSLRANDNYAGGLVLLG